MAAGRPIQSRPSELGFIYRTAGAASCYPRKADWIAAQREAAQRRQYLVIRPCSGKVYRLERAGEPPLLRAKALQKAAPAPA